MAEPISRSVTDRVRDVALRGVYAAGWRVSGPLPDGVRSLVSARLGRWARQRNGRHVQNLRRNLALTTNWPVSEELLDRALASYLRMQTEELALPSWSPEEIAQRVRTVNAAGLHRAYAETGAVVALPHSGNWDLAGAWAVQQNMPVTTVAERLADAEFNAFVRFRRGLGIEVLADRDPQTVRRLIAAVQQRRLVCLVSDRDLLGTGVPVSWAGHRITMPAGPALVARRSGAALIPATCHYTGEQMVITFGEPISPEPGREGLVAMTQQVADFFVRTIVRHPADWHMMQPFFPAADPAPGPGAGV